ncbi:nickel transporter permease [Bacillus sp. FJAT-44742]|uniref:nickel transporter permease n=1 Tax=Bacillus sp. FJAT-44742 TaxID=2014005 RepID=UPI000C249939|nr:nickel transporter permease [Bacillus sp. FJAT-44742]
MIKIMRKSTLPPGPLLALTCVMILCMAAILAPFIAPHDPTVNHMNLRLQPPSAEFWLGTDHLGRDIFSRLLYGARISLGSALIVVAVSMLISIVVGIISGYSGGVIDSLFMRACDVLISFPGLILVFALIAILGAGLLNLLVAMILVFWISDARLIRGMALSLKKRNYVIAAKLSGTPAPIIVCRHILPNVLPQVIILATLNIGSVILHIAAFSFLGLGIQPPAPEWGTMLNDSRPFLRSNPELMIGPGLMIFIVVLSFNILGDHYRDRKDFSLKEL